MKLSIGMIVKNEEKNIGKCLEALIPLMEKVESEVIVVDTGSDDDTIDIASKYTKKIFSFQWNNDFSEARNITIQKSSGEWFMFIDADEVLQDETDIVNFLNSGSSESYNTASVIIKNMVSHDDKQLLPEFSSFRMCRKTKDLKFSGRIHEMLNFKSPIKFLNASLIHSGYILNDPVLMEYKFKRNRDLLLKEVSERPNDFNTWYHLASVYFMHKDFYYAKEPIEKAYKIIKQIGLDPEAALNIYNLLINVYSFSKDYSKAKKAGFEILNSKKQDLSGFIDTYFYLANVCLNTGEYRQAAEFFKEYLRLVERYRNSDIDMDRTIVIYTVNAEQVAYMTLAKLYNDLGDYNEAKKYFGKVTDKAHVSEAVSFIIDLSIKFEKLSDLVDFYKEILLKGSYDKELLFIKSLEIKVRNNLNSKDSIYKLFAELEMESDYIYLNRIRTASDDSRIELLNTLINKKINNDIDIYGEYIYYYLKYSYNIEHLLSEFEPDIIDRYLQYIGLMFTDFPTIVADYFKKYNFQTNLENIRWCKALKRAALILDGINEEDYKFMFDSYVTEGISFMEMVYTRNVLDVEAVKALKNDEERFLLYMRKANMNKALGNDIEYVKYLRKALGSYTYMKRGIELTIDNYSRKYNDSNVVNLDTCSEMENYKLMFKDRIRTLISDGQVKEAMNLIEEYQSIIPNDLDIVYLKSEAKIKLS